MPVTWLFCSYSLYSNGFWRLIWFDISLCFLWVFQWTLAYIGIYFPLLCCSVCSVLSLITLLRTYTDSLSCIFHFKFCRFTIFEKPEATFSPTFLPTVVLFSICPPLFSRESLIICLPSYSLAHLFISLLMCHLSFSLRQMLSRV